MLCVDSRSVFEEAAAGVAADGTDPEDLAAYIEGLGRYREWFLRESPAEYLGRLGRLLSLMSEDIETMDRLAGVRVEGFLADPLNERAGLGALFRCLVGFLEVSRWIAGRENLMVERETRSFADAFRMLVGAGVLPAGDFQVYRELCRVRNRLAHALWDYPRNEEIYHLIREYAPRLRAFCDAVRARYLPGRGLLE